ncbi:MAG TPA: hypothetical protein VM076_00890, partial [Gemmatimonadaceae bacterium]|nr:hypothetical protein [Gemmatimonadaceae bacterium]
MELGRRRACAALAMLVAGARAGTAQLRTNADVAFNSHFVWRGVTSTNRLVIQPEVLLSAPVRGVTVLAGVWGNIEPVRYDGARDLSSLGGLPGPLVTQSQLWLELSGTIAGRLDATVGAQGYFYPHVGDLSQWTTGEVYISASAESFVSADVNVAYDFAQIRGTYVEGGLSRAITGERKGELTLGVAAGYSAGQAEDPRGRDLAYFERDGLTHVDASATATFNVGRVAFAPEAHVIFAHDSFAAITGPTDSRRTKLWLGTTLRWTN